MGRQALRYPPRGLLSLGHRTTSPSVSRHLCDRQPHSRGVHVGRPLLQRYVPVELREAHRRVPPEEHDETVPTLWRGLCAGRHPIAAHQGVLPAHYRSQRYAGLLELLKLGLRLAGGSVVECWAVAATSHSVLGAHPRGLRCTFRPLSSHTVHRLFSVCETWCPYAPFLVRYFTPLVTSSPRSHIYASVYKTTLRGSGVTDTVPVVRGRHVSLAPDSLGAPPRRLFYNTGLAWTGVPYE